MRLLRIMTEKAHVLSCLTMLLYLDSEMRVTAAGLLDNLFYWKVIHYILYVLLQKN